MKEWVGKADLFISKGGGNFDTLDEEKDHLPRPIVFMLLSKCHPYFKTFGVEVNRPILYNYPNKAMTLNHETRQVNTLCRMCDHGCGMVVTVENGIPSAVEGSRKHPFNKGWLCAKGRAALDFFNSPSRLKTPMVRKESGFAGSLLGGSSGPCFREDALAQEGIRSSEPRHLLRGGGRAPRDPKLHEALCQCVRHTQFLRSGVYLQHGSHHRRDPHLRRFDQAGHSEHPPAHRLGREPLDFP